ncbi:hypothetical protein [Desulfonema limicola]|uniref:hypothetical protein n=1 Tax=Desulfonema limicola TaxID=45656 RepID=UPI001A9B2A55|nr:hypothetical protein [Desulfonema limicola]
MRGTQLWKHRTGNQWNMVSLTVSANAETDPQGQAIGRQVWEITRKIIKGITTVARQTMAKTIDGAAGG